MKIILYFALLCVFLISACAPQPVTTLPPTQVPETEVVTVSPTASATEVVPTEVAISYEVPYSDEGKIDFDKIVNVLPVDKSAREEYFRRVKDELVKNQAIKYPDSTKIPQCQTENIINWGNYSEIVLNCFSDQGKITPDFVSRDENGDVIISFLGNFRDSQGAFSVPRLINAAVVIDELIHYMQNSNKAKSAFPPEIIWGEGDDLGIFFLGETQLGNVPSGLPELFPRMAAIASRTKSEGLTDEKFNQFIMDFDIDTLILVTTAMRYYSTGL